MLFPADANLLSCLMFDQEKCLNFAQWLDWTDWLTGLILLHWIPVVMVCHHHSLENNFLRKTYCKTHLRLETWFIFVSVDDRSQENSFLYFVAQVALIHDHNVKVYKELLPVFMGISSLKEKCQTSVVQIILSLKLSLILVRIIDGYLKFDFFSCRCEFSFLRGLAWCSFSFFERTTSSWGIIRR